MHVISAVLKCMFAHLMTRDADIVAKTADSCRLRIFSNQSVISRHVTKISVAHFTSESGVVRTPTAFRSCHNNRLS